MKTKNIVIIVAAVVVVIAVVAVVIFNTTPYNGYASAFDKTTKANSLNFDTIVKVTVDGKETTATGNMKIKNLSGNINFINVMNIEGKQITQFTDGENIYKEENGQKTKFKIGDKPQMTEKGEFNMDYYAQEFSGLLDASKIKDLHIVEKLDSKVIEKMEKKTEGSATVYDITLATQLVNDVFAQVINAEMEGAEKPACTLKSFKYKAAENASNAIGTITYDIDMDVVFPPSLTKENAEITKSVQIQLTMNMIDPGTAVEFTLPDTSGYN